LGEKPYEPVGALEVEQPTFAKAQAAAMRKVIFFMMRVLKVLDLPPGA
jgi:hypothetical protein